MRAFAEAGLLKPEERDVQLAADDGGPRDSVVGARPHAHGLPAGRRGPGRAAQGHHPAPAPLAVLPAALPALAPPGVARHPTGSARSRPRRGGATCRASATGSPAGSSTTKASRAAHAPLGPLGHGAGRRGQRAGTAGPQSRVPSRLRATRSGSRTLRSGWWNQIDRSGLIRPDEIGDDARLRLRQRSRAGVVAARTRDRPPPHREVAVQVDAVGVAPGAGAAAVGIDARHDPELHAPRTAAAGSVARRRGTPRIRRRGCTPRRAPAPARPDRPRGRRGSAAPERSGR